MESSNWFYVWVDDDCPDKTESLELAREWRDEFLREGRDSYIVDEDNNLVE
jgi:hypothetical protein